MRAGSPQGRFADSAALIDRQVLVGAEAWGKHLFVAFPDERFVHVHLGLYGHFDVHAGVAEVPAAVGQVRLRLVAADRDWHAYADLRGATTCELVTTAERDAVVARSGPDPLRADGDPALAWERIRRSRAPIAGLLMDQGVLAGVGNVYRAELLFRHRMDPFRPGNTLRRGQWQEMWDDLVVLMQRGRAHRPDRHRATGAHARGDGSPAAQGRPRRRGLRLPTQRPALPRLRTPGPDHRAAGAQPLLVWALPAQVPVPRTTVQPIELGRIRARGPNDDDRTAGG